MAKKVTVVCEIPRPDDIYIGPLCRPISLEHALQTMEALAKEKDLPMIQIQQTVENVIAYLSGDGQMGKLQGFSEKQLLISSITAYNFPQYPEELQRTVNAFLFTIKN